MESSRDVVIRALRTARSASDLLDFQTHQCYDTAFMQLATAIIAEAEIIMAHSQIEEVKNNARGLQKVAEEIRSLYPSGMGNNIVLMSSVQESLIESPSPEVVGDVVKALDLYTQAIWILRSVLLSKLPNLLLWLIVGWDLATQRSPSVVRYFQWPWRWS